MPTGGLKDQYCTRLAPILKSYHSFIARLSRQSHPHKCGHRQTDYGLAVAHIHCGQSHCYVVQAYQKLSAQCEIWFNSCPLTFALIFCRRHLTYCIPYPPNLEVRSCESLSWKGVMCSMNHLKLFGRVCILARPHASYDRCRL